MKKALTLLGVFLLGVLGGAVVMNLLEVRARPGYRQVIRSSLATEQELLAARAAREGDWLRSLVHRWNVVDAGSTTGFLAFRDEWAKPMEDDFWFPFRMRVLMLISAGPGGARATEALNRGKLAVALEKLGLSAAAEKQWKLAEELSGLSLDRFRGLVEKSIEMQRSKEHMQAEEAVLGRVSPRFEEGR